MGTTAPSQKDLFSTPHSATNSSTFQMSGVVLHAQMVSQLLDHLAGKRALFWHWPQGLEWGWFWLWAGVGALIARRWQNPWGLLGGLAIAVVSLWLICFILLLNMGWIPFVPAAITTILSGAAMLSYGVVYSGSHDRLTGLPNRSFLVKRLKAIAQKEKDKPFLAMMSLDIDRFKVINESFGHQAGDNLLKLTVGRIQHTLHEDYTLSRIGGDEFAILLENATNVGEVNQIADRLHQNLTLPVMLNQQEISTTVSIGIAISEPEEAIQADDLIRNAHTAMNRAKALGKDRHEIFSAGMRTQVVNRLQLESDLRQAIKKEEFVLYYQPILDLTTETIIGFEALVRWQSPERGFVSPGEFIPLAEETGLIIPLGEWILKQACQQMHQWHQQFSRKIPLIISVNLSIRQFSQPNLVEMVAQTIQETNLAPNSLKLEITESMVMDNVESAIEILESLKDLNLRLSMDDFGTGYSSLSYLHRFPMDTIKVDQSFVRRIKDNGDDSEIARTVVMLGHNLGMDIIAEGIETVNQKQILQSLDCEYGQGYLFSKPVPVELVPDLLRKIDFKDVKEMQR
ncbi:MAG: EAL domain-containing protein [Synechococcaceae cyanobacterium RL_1_2]|nr:EAL domain-containing protein [Synechococcaceae cyanobacterium RL_1_2]